MLTHLPFGVYNMRYQETSSEVSQMPNGTSDNANIKRNRSPSFQARLLNIKQGATNE